MAYILPGNPLRIHIVNWLFCRSLGGVINWCGYLARLLSLKQWYNFWSRWNSMVRFRTLSHAHKILRNLLEKWFRTFCQSRSLSIDFYFWNEFRWSYFWFCYLHWKLDRPKLSKNACEFCLFAQHHLFLQN